MLFLVDAEMKKYLGLGVYIQRARETAIAYTELFSSFFYWRAVSSQKQPLIL